MRSAYICAFLLATTACGAVTDKSGDASVDANGADATANAVDAAAGAADAATNVADAATNAADASVADASGPDAMPVLCTHVPATSTDTTILSYTLSGGAFQSFGCAPIDPTYWMSGSGMSVTITFVQAQSRPSIRVWGMNTDDTASIKVNGSAYTLNGTSASIAPKVVCGISPGPNGVAFVGGLLAGSNTNAEGNFSYNDVTLETTGVVTIEIAALSGAGWGFAGASVGCAN